MSDVVALSGRIDLAAVVEMHAAFADKAKADVVCDLGNVSQMGALGLQVLIAAADAARARGSSFELTNVPERISEQIGHMGLNIETLTKGTT